MALVKNYGISTTNDIAFTVVFAIPNNCEYVQTTSSGKYFITVSLMKGQTIPSSIFVNCSAVVNAIADVTDVEFKQLLNGVCSSKPKITVDNSAVGN